MDFLLRYWRAPRLAPWLMLCLMLPALTVAQTAVDLMVQVDGPASVTAGDELAFTVSVNNLPGSASVTGAPVTLTPPADLNELAWTCAASGGASCPASGSGPVDETVDLPVDAGVVFSVTGTVALAASADLSITATATPPAGATDTDPANNADTLSVPVLAAPSADLGLLLDGPAEAAPGGAVALTVVVNNTGPDPVSGAVLTASLPADLENPTWTCEASATAACVTGGGSGPVSETVDLPVGESVTLRIDATLAAAASGVLTVDATASVPATVLDPVVENNADSLDIAVAAPAGADLSVVINGPTAATAGQPVSFTIPVFNAGPADVAGGRLTVEPPAALNGVSWTCTATGAGTCLTGGGTAPVVEDFDLPANEILTVTVTGTVDPLTVEPLVVSATVAPPDGLSDPELSNNSNRLPVPVENTAVDLAVDLAGPEQVTAGESVEYLLTATNNGPAAASGATVSATLPMGLENVVWRCEPLGDAVCLDGAGSGPVTASVDLPAGASVRLRIGAMVGVEAIASLVLTATVTPPPGLVDQVPANDTDTVITAVAPRPAPPVAVPTLHPLALLALLGGLLGLGLLMGRRAARL